MTTAAPQTPPTEPTPDIPENRRLKRALILLIPLTCALTVVFYLWNSDDKLLVRIGLAVAAGLVGANIVAVTVLAVPRWAHKFGLPSQMDNDERHRQIILRSTQVSWMVVLAMVLFGSIALNNWYCYVLGGVMTLAQAVAVVVYSRRL